MRRDGKSVEFSILVRRFFSEYLLDQKNVSPETVLSYRDTFRILLVFFRERKNRDALSLRVEDLDAENILAYLDYLEKERGNSARTRNIRLAAIRSFEVAELAEPSQRRFR
jgi:integrase/recombinase XerD